MVEDDPAEAELAMEAFEETTENVEIDVVGDGVQALDYLRRQNGFEEKLAPDLMLLDLNLPIKDGRAVLAEMKGDPYLRQIPVIVLSNSSADEDIAEVYRLNGNCYIVKPPNLKEMFSLARSLINFWNSVQFAKIGGDQN